MVDLSGEFGIDFADLFTVRDPDGNNLLMELAKNMKDDALRDRVVAITKSVISDQGILF